MFYVILGYVTFRSYVMFSLCYVMLISVALVFI
jgi:hypothetical protein